MFQERVPRLHVFSVDDQRFAIEVLVTVHKQRNGLGSVAPFVERGIAELDRRCGDRLVTIAHIWDLWLLSHGA